MDVLVIITDSLAKYMSYLTANKNPRFGEMMKMLHIAEDPKHLMKWKTKLDSRQYIGVKYKSNTKKAGKADRKLDEFFRAAACECGEPATIKLMMEQLYVCVPCYKKHKKRRQGE